ncbi:chaperonin 10-like protein [Aspergillus karnatakaensis]|uniref:2,3-butanediol dehydrogenase n=1 Tax=Aspergillus karnatakaensis TaxID=1810916 RepID=UPI003CCD58F4
MTSKITALQYYGPRDVRLEQVKPKICHRDEVRIQIAYCGICGSDIHEYLGGPIFPPKQGEQNPWTGQRLPVTLGHEMSGTIVEVGASVSDPRLQTGARVAVNPAWNDRHHGLDPCTACQLDMPNVCKRYASYGLSAAGGGLASEIVVKHFACIPLPDSVSLKVGALMEPLAVAWHCIRISGFQPGQTALILGAGPIGLAILMLLHVWNAKTVVISEVTASRKQMAKEFGADLVVDPTEYPKGGLDPVVVATQAAVQADGVDVCFDCTGLQSTLDTAVAAARPGGTVFNVAIYEQPVSLNLNALTLTEKRLTGGICYTDVDFQGLIEALESGKVAAEKLITSVVDLDDVIDKGLLELIQNKAAHVKILIRPSQPRSVRL